MQAAQPSWHSSGTSRSSVSASALASIPGEMWRPLKAALAGTRSASVRMTMSVPQARSRMRVAADPVHPDNQILRPWAKEATNDVALVGLDGTDRQQIDRQDRHVPSKKSECLSENRQQGVHQPECLVELIQPVGWLGYGVPKASAVSCRAGGYGLVTLTEPKKDQWYLRVTRLRTDHRHETGRRIAGRMSGPFSHGAQAGCG
jgi:hypothetical protein